MNDNEIGVCILCMFHEWRSIYFSSVLLVLSSMTVAIAACEQSAYPALHAASTWGRGGGGGAGEEGGREREKGVGSHSGFTWRDTIHEIGQQARGINIQGAEIHQLGDSGVAMG